MSAAGMKVTEVAPGYWLEVKQGAEWEWLEVTAVTREGLKCLIVFSSGEQREYSSDEEVVASDGPPEGIAPRHEVPAWDEYFMAIAQAVSLRAKCRRRQVGALLVDKDHRIVSTGYNGAPRGMKDCLEGGCPRGLTQAGTVEARSPYSDPASPGYCPAIHAEENSVLFSSKEAWDTTCYTTDAPCPNCTRVLAAAGVTRVVWRRNDGSLHEGDPRVMLAQRGVEKD